MKNQFQWERKKNCSENFILYAGINLFILVLIFFSLFMCILFWIVYVLARTCECVHDMRMLKRMRNQFAWKEMKEEKKKRSTLTHIYAHAHRRAREKERIMEWDWTSIMSNWLNCILFINIHLKLGDLEFHNGEHRCTYAFIWNCMYAEGM